jgi:uncharacterized protein (DUF2249 family)
MTVPLTLAEEHALLLGQVAVRADDVLAMASADRWPVRELSALLGYLRVEVLRQAADEEALLFPARPALPGFVRLRHGHRRLRRRVEVLADAVHGGAEWTVSRLTMTISELLGSLERHIAVEDALLHAACAPHAVPATAALTGRPHEWYPLTESTVIDVDALPPGQVIDAAVERLARLRPGECVEVRSTGDDLDAVWRRLDRLEPGAYGFVYLQEGPLRWVARVTRRPAA